MLSLIQDYQKSTNTNQIVLSRIKKLKLISFNYFHLLIDFSAQKIDTLRKLNRKKYFSTVSMEFYIQVCAAKVRQPVQLCASLFSTCMEFSPQNRLLSKKIEVDSWHPIIDVFLEINIYIATELFWRMRDAAL